MKRTTRNSNKAYTLVEITLVLGLTLMLITALLVGITAFNDGADRARCIMNLSSLQKSMRSFMNLYEFRPGESFADAKEKPDGLEAALYDNIVGDGKFINRDLTCPNPKAGPYKGGDDVFPEVGTMWFECDLRREKGHALKDTRNQ